MNLSTYRHVKWDREDPPRLEPHLMNVGPLRVLALQQVEITPTLRHVEIYTMTGLLTLLWHGPDDAQCCVLAGGGAMGGLLGPANGFYHWLGDELAADGIAMMRVGYRRPNDLDACIGDMVAAGMLAERQGAEHFVTVGHSFGGAVAINVGLEPSPIGPNVRGVCTFATQSAGCEHAALLGGKPLLMFHGDKDEILPQFASEVVHQIAGGTGELVILEGAGHILGENGAGQVLRDRVPSWIRTVLKG